MKERPLIFGPDSVRAILAGEKTQTRRVVKLPLPSERYELLDAREPGKAGFVRTDSGSPHIIHCPYGAVGDRLWCRESFFVVTGPTDGSPPTLDNSLVHHKADADPELIAVADRNKLWTSPLFMPRWASRLTLELTDVRVERLRDISDADILAEGITVAGVARSCNVPWGAMPTLYDAWNVYWDSINAKRGFPAKSKPYVWVLTFKRIEP